MLSKKLLSAVCACFLLSDISALAASTEWLTRNEMKREFSKLKRNGQIATKKSCKNGDKYNPSSGAILMKVQFKKNVNKIKFTYTTVAGGHRVMAQKLKKQGGRLVSQSTFVRPGSGLKVYCALWHK